MYIGRTDCLSGINVNATKSNRLEISVKPEEGHNGQVWLSGLLGEGRRVHHLPSFLSGAPGWTMRYHAEHGWLLISDGGGVLSLDVDGCESVQLVRHRLGGKARISYNGREQVVDLYATEESIYFVDLQESQAPDLENVLALYVPRWRGTTASTTSLFPNTMPVPESDAVFPEQVTDEDLDDYAERILETDYKILVVSGGDRFFLDLIRRVYDRDRSRQFNLLWHSNALQLGETYDREMLAAWIEAARDGLVRRIGFVKRGMAELVRSFGVSTAFVHNYVPLALAKETVAPSKETVGIWLSGSSSYRKVPYAMLYALAGLPRLTLTGAGFDNRSIEIISRLGVSYRDVHIQPLPKTRMLEEMRQTSLSLYVTFSECAPMVPLESFSVGVPCIIGPSCHYFDDDEYLRSKLVAEQPGSAKCIAEKVDGYFADHNEIRRRLFDYLRGYNLRAQQSVLSFVL